MSERRIQTLHLAILACLAACGSSLVGCDCGGSKLEARNGENDVQSEVQEQLPGILEQLEIPCSEEEILAYTAEEAQQICGVTLIPIGGDNDPPDEEPEILIVDNETGEVVGVDVDGEDGNSSPDCTGDECAADLVACDEQADQTIANQECLAQLLGVDLPPSHCQTFIAGNGCGSCMSVLVTRRISPDVTEEPSVCADHPIIKAQREAAIARHTGILSHDVTAQSFPLAVSAPPPYEMASLPGHDDVGVAAQAACMPFGCPSSCLTGAGPYAACTPTTICAKRAEVASPRDASGYRFTCVSPAAANP